MTLSASPVPFFVTRKSYVCDGKTCVAVDNDKARVFACKQAALFSGHVVDLSVSYVCTEFLPVVEIMFRVMLFKIKSCISPMLCNKCKSVIDIMCRFSSGGMRGGGKGAGEGGNKGGGGRLGVVPLSNLRVPFVGLRIASTVKLKMSSKVDKVSTVSNDSESRLLLALKKLSSIAGTQKSGRICVMSLNSYTCSATEHTSWA